MNQTLILDEIDKRIVTIIQKDPTITHTKLAKKVNRSQPTIGMRIKKLEKSGILKFQAGLGLKNLDYSLAKIDIQTSNPTEIIHIIESCPFVIQGFRISGSTNFVIIIACSTLKDLDRIVNYHFRKNPEVKLVSTEIISELISEFIVPVEFQIKSCDCLRK
ncbi:MAG: Lrp/AsnC family transcriptional regulator [Candidatus Lokiarchaeia archaeon]|nr:Lrp/AsnC family transcriptional regulator [Candidatus Lokiarchaeia archaeon]